MDLNYLKEKYESTLVKRTDPALDKIVVSYIRMRGFAMYGGTAIDILIRAKSNNADRLYDVAKEKDYDMFCDDPYKDTQDLAAEIYGKMPIQHIKIVTGLTGKTRKIFLDLNPNAIVDMSPYPKKLRWFITDIGGIRIVHPHILKIDQYKNLSIDVYNNNHRIEKNVKKIVKLEKYYPVTLDTIDELHLTDRIFVYDKMYDAPIDPFSDTDDVVFGGDFVYEYYYNGVFSDTAEVILYTNYYPNPEGLKYPIPEKGILAFPRYRIMGLEESMLCYFIEDEAGREIKICTKLTLLYEYYRLLYLTHDSRYVEKLIRLTSDPDLLPRSPEIHLSSHQFIKEFTPSMASLWYLNGKRVDK